MEVQLADPSGIKRSALSLEWDYVQVRCVYLDHFPKAYLLSIISYTYLNSRRVSGWDVQLLCQYEPQAADIAVTMAARTADEL